MKTILRIVAALLIAGLLVVTFLGIATYAGTKDEQWIEVGTCTITHYCSCKKCCGNNTLTKTGTKPKRYQTIAVDPKVIPLGSLVYIETYGYRIAEDTGSAIKGKHIDVYTEDHKHALQLGKQKHKVWIVKQKDPSTVKFGGGK